MAQFSLDWRGWHIWRNAAGRIVANGPAYHNRHAEFDSLESAARYYRATGRAALAAAIMAKGADNAAD